MLCRVTCLVEALTVKLIPSNYENGNKPGCSEMKMD